MRAVLSQKVNHFMSFVPAIVASLPVKTVESKMQNACWPYLSLAFQGTVRKKRIASGTKKGFLKTKDYLITGIRRKYHMAGEK